MVQISVQMHMCNCHGLNVIRQAVFKFDHKSIQGHFPIPDRHGQFFNCRVIGREQLTLFDHFTDHAIEGFNGVGGVDGLTNIFRVVEQGIEIVPVARGSVRNSVSIL
jgi:hypothetical protein